MSETTVAVRAGEPVIECSPEARMVQLGTHYVFVDLSVDAIRAAFEFLELALVLAKTETPTTTGDES